MKLYSSPLLFFLSTLLACHTLADPITITLKIDGMSDYEVRNEAKRRVSQSLFDELPSIVSGKETLKNENLTTHIESLSLSAVNVVTLSEQWDRKTNSYTLVADASINEDIAFTLLDDVQDNIALQQNLKRAFGMISDLQSSHSTQDNLILNNPVSVTEYDSRSQTQSYERDARRIEAFKIQKAMIDDGFITSPDVIDTYRTELNRFYGEHLFPNFIQSFNIKKIFHKKEDPGRFKVRFFKLPITAKRFRQIQTFHSTFKKHAGFLRICGLIKGRIIKKGIENVLSSKRISSRAIDDHELIVEFELSFNERYGTVTKQEVINTFKIVPCR